MKRRISTCALCLQTKPLCKSHIVPDFLFKDAVDWLPPGSSLQPQPHLTRVDFDTAQRIYCHQKGNVVKMEGLAEYLLCEECEKLVQIGEHYANVHLIQPAPAGFCKTRVKTVFGYRWRRGKVLRQGYELHHVDYSKLKHFQIGIIWRACVATGAAFREIKAATATLERMRLALLSGGFDEHLAPCTMTRVYSPPGVSPGVLLPFAAENWVQFIFGGHVWRFFMDGNAPGGTFLRKDGRLPVLVVDIDALLTPDWMLEGS